MASAHHTAEVSRCQRLQQVNPLILMLNEHSHRTGTPTPLQDMFKDSPLTHQTLCLKVRSLAILSSVCIRTTQRPTEVSVSSPMWNRLRPGSDKLYTREQMPPNPVQVWNPNRN